MHPLYYILVFRKLPDLRINCICQIREMFAEGHGHSRSSLQLEKGINRTWPGSGAWSFCDCKTVHIHLLYMPPHFYTCCVFIDRFHNGRGRVRANFQMAGSNIWVPGREQLTRSVQTNGAIKLAARDMYADLYSCKMCFVTVMSVDATMSYFSSLLPVAKARYQKKLLLVGLSTCPYEPPQQAWADDVAQWPRVEFPDIVLYLIIMSVDGLVPVTFTSQVKSFAC